MRLWKLIWVTAGAGALFAARNAAATEIIWGRCEYDPLVTWYTQNTDLNFPNYFCPPYPYSDYLPSFYATPPVLTGLAVKQQLLLMGAYPVPLPKETLPPPIPEGKRPEQILPPPKPGDNNPAKEGPPIK